MNEMITLLQSDMEPLSEVYFFFQNLPYKYLEMNLSEDQHSYLNQLALYCFSFIATKAHALYYLLDPRYLGKLMTLDEKDAAEEKLFSMTDVEQNTILEEYMSFREYCKKHQEKQSLRFQMLQKLRGNLKFWVDDGEA